MIEPLYVAARGVLLDALDALGEQREALILAGAQAIYIHTGAADLAVAEFTTDGDLVVNPEQLKTQPRLSEAMVDEEEVVSTRTSCWVAFLPRPDCSVTVRTNESVGSDWKSSSESAHRWRRLGAVSKMSPKLR